MTLSTHIYAMHFVLEGNDVWFQGKWIPDLMGFLYVYKCIWNGRKGRESLVIITDSAMCVSQGMVTKP